MLSDFAARKEAKIERFRELAEKNHNLSDQTLNQARHMADIIPFGQPILIGHHSEKRDRNYRDRIWSKFEKAAEIEEKAKYYERRVQAAEAGKLAISSDDPDAIALLKEKLEGRIKAQEVMRGANKIIKSKKPADQKKTEIISLGVPSELAENILKGKRVVLFGESEFVDPSGFPSFALTNNNANIKRIQGRIIELERKQADQTTEQQIGDITITNSVEDNRIMITFPGIPDESIRARLKSDGFRWSPSNGAWQAYRSAAWKIPDIVGFLTTMPGYVNPEKYIFI
jgi:hypothetical protein